MTPHLDATRVLIRLALDEDIGHGDLTAKAVPENTRAEAKLVAKQAITVSGLELVTLTLEVFAGDVKVAHTFVRDGQAVESGTVLLTLKGCARDLLTVERTLLNFLQRTCGVATLAQKHKAVAAGLTVLDTRKTTPGFRHWEKKAVKDGGLTNHRFRLDDGVLIKENHIRAAGSITRAISNLGKASVPVEVEVTTWEEAKEAIDCGVMRLLLDNFTPAGLKAIVLKLRDYKPGLFLEASGGISLSTLKDFSETGVDAVSIGALTHSAPAADLSLLFSFSGG